MSLAELVSVTNNAVKALDKKSNRPANTVRLFDVGSPFASPESIRSLSRDCDQQERLKETVANFSDATTASKNRATGTKETTHQEKVTVIEVITVDLNNGDTNSTGTEKFEQRKDSNSSIASQIKNLPVKSRLKQHMKGTVIAHCYHNDQSESSSNYGNEMKHFHSDADSCHSEQPEIIDVHAVTCDKLCSDDDSDRGAQIHENKDVYFGYSNSNVGKVSS